MVAREFRVRQAGERFNDSEPQLPSNPDMNLVTADNHHYAVFSKTLPHNQFGEVSVENYSKLQTALETGEQEDFDAIMLAPSSNRKLANPQATFSFEFKGQDNYGVQMKATPLFHSEESLAEMIEVYEKALHRDIPFSLIETGDDPNTVRAINALNQYAEFTGPKEFGQVTSKSLFRGLGQDELIGPYVSQLLYHSFNYGNLRIEQQFYEELDDPISVTEQGFVDIQNGAYGGPANKSGAKSYVHSPRMLGSVVHNDPLFQAYYNGALILLQNGAPLDPNIPMNPNEGNFATFGGADILGTVCEVARIALKAAWYNKWIVNCRLRPETFAGRIHFQDKGMRDYGLTLDSRSAPTIDALKLKNGNCLLPLQYPEGSPTHPSYPAGHAVVAGACTTVMKAFFDTNAMLSATNMTPMHSTDGTALTPYIGSDSGQMTVLGEINKLASNMAIGRNMAGVHYRSDGDQGIVLGEKVAIQFLKDVKAAYHEEFEGWSLTKLDGETITI